MERQPPSPEEVMARLKDDGDFDALRQKIIRALKDNEDLRKSIIEEVKQSVALNEDGAENMKIRELSDAIYKELGAKLMGQISDAAWGAIKSKQDDIRGTVESVYNRIMYPEVKQEVQRSPQKNLQSNGHISPEKSIATGTKDLEDDELPPGFGLPAHGAIDGGNPNHQSLSRDHEIQYCEDEVPPGFGGSSNGAIPALDDEEDPDLPPGFG